MQAPVSKPFIRDHIKRLFKGLANPVEKRPAAGSGEKSNGQSAMTQCEALLIDESTETDRTAPPLNIKQQSPFKNHRGEIVRWKEEQSEERGTEGLICYSSDSCTITIFLPLGYHDNHIVIRWFWAAVERFNNEQRLRLLQVWHVGDRMHIGCPPVEAGCPAGAAESCLPNITDVLHCMSVV